MFDSLLGSGKLEKMSIWALKDQVDPKVPPEVTGAEGDSYMVQVNPDSYTLSHQVYYERTDTNGRPPSNTKFNGMSPAKLDFTIIFDGTGIIPPPAGVLDNIPIVGAIADLLGGKKEFDLMEEIRKFTKVVYSFDGDQHRPRNIRLAWGRQIYDGVLTSLSLNYKLFKPDGTPLRAEARVSFDSSLSQVMLEAVYKTSSPDLTHIRTSIAGDTLPLMTHSIYGQADHYIAVAKVNKLFNFRKLPDGQSIFFPPVKKEAS